MLHEVGRTEEHTPKALLDLIVSEHGPFAQNQDLEIFPDPSLAFPPSQDKVILYKEYIHLLPEGPELKGRVCKLFKIVNHSRPFGIPIDIPYTGQVVLVGVDDA